MTQVLQKGGQKNARHNSWYSKLIYFVSSWHVARNGYIAEKPPDVFYKKVFLTLNRIGDGQKGLPYQFFSSNFRKQELPQKLSDF